MKKKPVTSLEVAQRAGVSRASVSRAFNDKDSVTPGTREKVLKAADELGYQVNLLGRSMNRQRTDLVGLVVRKTTDPFHARLLEALLHAIGDHNYLPTVSEITDDEDIKQTVQKFTQFRVSGVIVTSGSPPVGIVEECTRLRIPVVIINRQLDYDFLDAVCSDNQQGAQLAADHLLKAGCQQLCYLNNQSSTYSGNIRGEAFINALAPKMVRGEITFKPIEACQEGYQGGFLAAERIQDASFEFDGLFCATDLLAMGFIDGARRFLNKNAGRDYSIVGFDNLAESSWHAYQLTSIKQDVEAISKTVMDRLITRMDDSEAEKNTDLIPVQLIERNSVHV